MPPTLFQAAASASYWFLVDCGPGLYSEPEFGPIAAKITGDLELPDALGALPPEALGEPLELVEHAFGLIDSYNIVACPAK